MIEYSKIETISIKGHPELSEKWVQERIAEDPSILGLGDVLLKDKERPQPKAGRLDILLQEAETNRRYEVEVQLGKSDESHIIRTIEYWDIERKQYPQYDHCAVIIAEDITTRFLNVISLFNGHIPLIALQMTAIKNGNSIGLIFTKILDELSLGLIDEDEEEVEVTDRDYWLQKGSKETVEIAESLQQLIQDFAPGYQLNYNKHYIGLNKNNRSNNFVAFRPKKKWMHLLVKIPKTIDNDNLIEGIGLDYTYERIWRQYRINLREDDLEQNKEVITNLARQAWEFREG